jgi:hemerythrin superfamily protein
LTLIDVLSGEHGIVNALFDHVERELSDTPTLEGIQRTTRALAAALLSHAQIEDELLFGALEAQIGPHGPLAVMRHEHEEIERALALVAAAQNPDEAVERVRRALSVSREHFAKEECVLFNIARRSVPPQELERLCRTWGERRHVAVE